MGDDEALRLLENREADMRRESGAEPERVHLLAADALVPQPELDHVREQSWDRERLDELDLTADELVEGFAVDSVVQCSSFAYLLLI